jgi:hypothetical protein
VSYFSRGYFAQGFYAPSYWGAGTSTGGDGAKDMEYLVRYHADVQRRLAQQRNRRDEEAILLALVDALDEDWY